MSAAEIAVPKPVSLVRKLCNVMGAIDRVAKTGHNAFHKYDYATESDITAAVRGFMASEGVFMITTIAKIDWEMVETRSDKRERFCTISAHFIFYDADSPEKIEFDGVGQGQDPGDKAAFKALTGAVKYGLLKSFLIPTGNDPEEASPESGNVIDVAAVKAKAERAAGLQRMQEAFAAIGVSPAQLDAMAGGPLANIDNATWTRLRKEYDATKAKNAALAGARDPVPHTASAEMRAQIDAHQERLASPLKADEKPIREPTDAELAAEREARKRESPVEPEQVARNVTFANFVQQVRDAESVEAVTLIGAAGQAAKLPPGDLKALLRQCTDRILILKDKKRVPIQDQSTPEKDLPF